MNIELLNIGDKLTMKVVSRSLKEDGKKQVNLYKSQIYDILPNYRLKIGMPMKGQKLLLIPIGAEYEMLFFASKGLYMASGKIVDRYKSDNLYILEVDLISELVRNQRREYYRLDTSIETMYRKISENEIEQKSSQKIVSPSDGNLNSNRDQELLKIIEDSKEITLDKEEGYIPGIIVDISGGGVRMVSDKKLEKGDYIHFIFRVQRNFLNRECSFVGLVLLSEELPARKNQYEHRIQYCNIEKSEREMIIKYIFEEERKKRKNEMS